MFFFKGVCFVVFTFCLFLLFFKGVCLVFFYLFVCFYLFSLGGGLFWSFLVRFLCWECFFWSVFFGGFEVVFGWFLVGSSGFRWSLF